MRLMDLHIDPDFDALMPALDGAAYGSLRDHIEAHGVQVPIVVAEDGTILDGHHRYRACRELEIEEAPIDVKAGLSRPAMLALAISLNLERRQLSRAQRDALIRRLRQEQGMSTRQIAAAVGVHKDTVRNALNTGGELSPPEPPARVTGKDGKSYPARRKATVQVRPAEYACAVCGEKTDRPVWHCDGCQRHWPLNVPVCPDCGPRERPEAMSLPPDARIERLREARLVLLAAREAGAPDDTGAQLIGGLLRNLDDLVVRLRRARGEIR